MADIVSFGCVVLGKFICCYVGELFVWKMLYYWLCWICICRIEYIFYHVYITDIEDNFVYLFNDLDLLNYRLSLITGVKRHVAWSAYESNGILFIFAKSSYKFDRRFSRSQINPMKYNRWELAKILLKL